MTGLRKNAGTLLPHVGAEGVPKGIPQCPRIFSQTRAEVFTSRDRHGAVGRCNRTTACLRARLVRRAWIVGGDATHFWGAQFSVGVFSILSMTTISTSPFFGSSFSPSCD